MKRLAKLLHFVRLGFVHFRFGNRLVVIGWRWPLVQVISAGKLVRWERDFVITKVGPDSFEMELRPRRERGIP